MKILFISRSTGKKGTGITYSVPEQIKSIAKYDDVFWYNMLPIHKEEWDSLPFYHTVEEYPERTIECLPEPFDTPDLVVFEQLYDYGKYIEILLSVKKKKIPYVIVPRSEFTRQGQNRKKLKKFICNILFFKYYANGASAIHYLTNQEMDDSGKKWNKSSFVIPNGIIMHDNIKSSFNVDKIECSFIGRIEPYQKGIDLLIDACESIKEILEENNVRINMYGPISVQKKEKMELQLKEKGLEKIICFKDAVYDEEKKSVLMNTDVFLLTSRFEGHPMALIEALSYGVPALITEGANMRCEVEKYNAGWTADTTMNGIQKALLGMIRDKQKFIEKGVNARTLAANYNWDSIAQRTHEEYERIVREQK